MELKPLLKLLPVSLGLLLACSCAKPSTPAQSDASTSQEPSISVIAPIEEPEPEPLPFTNPLTGEGCETDIGQNRPIAIMINNLKKAQPQLGVSQADIIYEVPAEGGITRMLAVFQSVEGVGNIGSVRSARDYYVSLAAGLDAIYMHAGGSPGAYSAIQNWGVNALDCVNGPYEGSLYWRDRDRRRNAGYEHSVLTSGEKILELFPTYTNLRQTHKEGYTTPFQFHEDGTPVGGSPAYEISVRFSNYKTGIFTYDEETGLYRIAQYGKEHIDGNNDEQLAVRNVLILRTGISVISGDSAGRLKVNLVGSGKGVFICGGSVINITWHKDSNTGPMTFKTESGYPLALGVGKTYINIVGNDYEVTIDETPPAPDTTQP